MGYVKSETCNKSRKDIEKSYYTQPSAEQFCKLVRNMTTLQGLEKNTTYGISLNYNYYSNTNL